MAPRTAHISQQGVCAAVIRFRLAASTWSRRRRRPPPDSLHDQIQIRFADRLSNPLQKNLLPNGAKALFDRH
jgi:hypothetical protein